jgi:RecA/RadA recombinase
MDRRAKYSSNKSNTENIRIDIKFDITELDLMCAYIVSENRLIHRGNIINLRNVLDICNMSVYGNDQECLNRINFIRKGIEARLNKNLSSTFMILREITGGLGVNSSLQFRELNNTEIEWVNTSISEILKYASIEAKAEEGLSLFTKLKSTEYANRGNVVKEIETWLTDVQNKLRKSKSDGLEDIVFSLDGDRYIEAMVETHQQLTSPSNRLVFGTQALNLLTGGGLQSARVYCILGLPGEGKSSTMLEWAIQIKKYNKNYVCKDPTKRPCVVLFVMENSIKETVQRLFSMCIGKDMTNFSQQEAIELLNQGLHVDDNDPIDLIIKFKPNLSVDTSYLYTLVDDLEDEGYEVICVLQDYLKRIRSVEGSFGGDLRQQLGAVVNEFKVFATLKNIPVVTASQLNRTATNSIDVARIKNKSDLVRLIGRANVGDSNLILDNSDWICLIAPEEDIITHEKFLGIQRVKSRYYIPDGFHYAYIPYIKDTIKFVEDVYAPQPCHRTSMREAEMPNGMSGNMIGGINTVQNFSDIEGVSVPADDIDNLFINATCATRVYYNIPTPMIQYNGQIRKKKMYSLINNK